MSKYAGLLEQFGRYHRDFTLAGLKPTRDDIEEFMEKFFTRTAFHMGATSWDASTKPFKGASSRNRATGEVVYTIDTKKTTKENIDEIRPILHEAFLKAHGSFGVATDNFDPKPFVPVTDEQKVMHEYMKDFTYRYNQLTLPFRLRKTMHHELQAVVFRGGEIATSKRFTLHSEKEIREYIDARQYSNTGKGGHGGSNRGLRDIWWRANPTGIHPKVGIIDIDNPADVPFDDYARITYDIAKRFSLVHSTLVVFTGKSFQVWFSTKPMSFDTVQECWDYIYSTVNKATKDIAFKADEGITRRVPVIDKGPMMSDRMNRMLFGMHYKPKGLDSSTGYACIPVALNRVKKFNYEEAHPVAVMRDFERLKGMADAWFVSAEVGDGFEETEAAPPCNRIPRTNPDKENPLVVSLNAWKKQPMPEIRYRDIGEEVLQHKRLVVAPKYDGQMGLLAFNKRGGFKVHGERLDSRKGEARAGMDIERCVMVSEKNGVIAWDNYLTREFERICQENDVDSIEVVIESIVIDAMGKVIGHNESSSILSTGTDNHDPTTFRNLKGVIIDVLSLDGKDLSSMPYEERLMKAADLEGDRIRCLDPTIVEDDHESVVRAIWRGEVEERNNEGLVVHAGGNRYKVKRRFTLDVAVMGIAKGKIWQDQKPRVGSVLVGVSKSTKDGMAIIPIGRVGGFSHAAGAELFNLVLGEQVGDYGFFEKSVRNPYLEEIYPDIHLVEPSVIIEIEFMELSGRRTISGPSIIRKATRGGTGIQMRMNVTKKEYYSRSPMGPPQFLRIRYDKDIEDSSDYSFRQGDTAGGFEIGVKGDAIRNPNFNVPAVNVHGRVFVSKSGLTSVVLPNPLFGYAAGPRYVSGGPQPFTLPDWDGIVFETTPMGHAPLQPAGKTSNDEWLTLKDEFAGQLKMEDGKWGLHYAPEKHLRFPKDKDGIAYFLDIPGFPVGSDDAIFDEEGPNLGGIVHDKKREEVLYHNQLLMEYMEDDEQKRKDANLAMLANSDQSSMQSFPMPIGELPDDDFNKDFYATQAEEMAKQFGRKQFNAKADTLKRAEGLRRIMRNPEHTEDSKTDDAVGGSKAGVIRAFDAFMTFEDEEE
jgi:hypothetical protein